MSAVYQKNNLEHTTIKNVCPTPFYQHNDVAWSTWSA